MLGFVMEIVTVFQGCEKIRMFTCTVKFFRVFVSSHCFSNPKRYVLQKSKY